MKMFRILMAAMVIAGLIMSTVGAKAQQGGVYNRSFVWHTPDETAADSCDDKVSANGGTNAGTHFEVDLSSNPIPAGSYYELKTIGDNHRNQGQSFEQVMNEYRLLDGSSVWGPPTADLPEWEDDGSHDQVYWDSHWGYLEDNQQATLVFAQAVVKIVVWHAYPNGAPDGRTNSVHPVSLVLTQIPPEETPTPEVPTETPPPSTATSIPETPTSTPVIQETPTSTPNNPETPTSTPVIPETPTSTPNNPETPTSTPTNPPSTDVPHPTQTPPAVPTSPSGHPTPGAGSFIPTAAPSPLNPVGLFLAALGGVGLIGSFTGPVRRFVDRDEDLLFYQ